MTDAFFTYGGGEEKGIQSAPHHYSSKHETHPSDFGERSFKIARVDLVAETRDVQVVARIVAGVAVSL